MTRKNLAVVSLSIFVFAACAPRVALTPTPAPLTETAPPPTTVTPTAASTGPTASPTAEAPAGPCTDAAAFVEDVTEPDYSHFEPWEAFVKTWRVKNIGTCTWTADYKAAYVRGDALGAATSIPLSETAPGATLDISTQMMR